MKIKSIYYIVLLVLVGFFSACTSKTGISFRTYELDEVFQCQPITLAFSASVTLPDNGENKAVVKAIRDDVVKQFISEDLIKKRDNQLLKAYYATWCESVKNDAAQFSDYSDDMEEQLEEDFFDEIMYEENFSISVAMCDEQSGIITFLCDRYTYLGGAHGYDAVQYVTYSLADGSVVGFDDIFAPNSVADVTKLMQKELSKQDVFLFGEVDQVELSNNFFMTENGIAWVYLQYEIAPYSEGIIVVEVPAQRLKPYMLEDCAVASYFFKN